MRSFFAKIFFSTLLIYPVARGLGLLILGASGALGPPPLPPFVRDALPLYGQAAVATLEQAGPDALRGLIARTQAQTGLRIELAPVAPDGCRDAPPPRGPGQPRPAGPPPARLAIPSGTGAVYCLSLGPPSPNQAGPDHAGPHPPPWDLIVPPLELVCCAVVSFLLARYLANPVRQIRAAAAAFAGGDLSARAGGRIGRRRDEAADLVREFDHMADRVASLIQSQRRFIGDVSHEIKSPLARLSMALGLARRDAGEDGAGPDEAGRFDRMEREIETVSALIRELQVLSVLQGSVGPRARAPIDLVKLVEAAIDDAAFEWPDRAHGLRLVRQGEPAATRGDAALLQRAVANVLRNALFYTPDTAAVEVIVEGSATWSRIVVRDHGPGVPPDALPHLFEPFYRVDEARARNTGGVGLGLAICERAVALHGGRIGAENGTPQGLVVSIGLPGLGPDTPASGAVPAPG